MTSKGAGFVKADRQGNQIYAEGSNRGSTVEELSRGDIEERNLNPEKDIVVEELGESGSTIRERQEGEHVVKIEPDSLANSRLSKFFTDSEIEELQSKEDTVQGEDTPEDIDSVWDGIRKDVKRHNREVAKSRKQMEIRRAKEELKKGTKYDPDRSVSDLSGEEFKEIIAEANQEGNSEPESEELQAAIEHIEDKYSGFLEEDSDTEINTPDSQVEELAANSWEDYENSAFQDIAEDLAKSDENTLYESVGENSRRVTTKDPEIKKALRNPEDEPNWNGSVELEKDTGDTVIAVVSKEN
ncbi:hypothetical protein [Halorubrum ezzemoulense]|uniref:Uncharacterized protein n=1 Tax=Halorubrum ezzemoulense TaxID=337243 RepID=A0A481RG17_HALEZ|nr:hypothetical protein [Halorubrum ezzemoulense]QAY20184.1 hypothetical protein EO776_09275 [Halorubrum ezzemoulense]